MLLILTRFSQSVVLDNSSITIVILAQQCFTIHVFTDCFSLASYRVNVIVPFSLKQTVSSNVFFVKLIESLI